MRQKRKPSAISNWIAAGKISKAALIGEGVRAHIWLEQALRDLQLNLDPGQQSAQRVPVTADDGRHYQPPLITNVEDDDLRRRRKADADRAEHDAEAARRKLLVDEGKYVV